MIKPIQIRIGTRTPNLDEVLFLNTETSWMLITAWNPIGAQGTLQELAAQNHRANVGLLDHIQQSGRVAIPMWGLGDKMDWGPEASWLVLGVPKEDVRNWALRYGQRACVWGEKGQRAQLISSTEKPLPDAYRETTYQNAPCLLNHGTLTQQWLKGCRSHRVSYESESQTGACLQLPIQDGGVLCFWMD